jgi:S1-C subfamily serine protease
LGGRTVGPKRIEGRLDTLDITFPKNKLRIPAKLVRISNEHDVALIKIDTPQAITKVEIDDTYDAVRPGDPITIMGYPGVSPSVFVATKSQDPFNPLQDLVSVPDPTVTPGIIGKVIRGIAQPVGGEVGDYYSESDSFQLTATATGGGNSGGPVFNEYGRVIGIFYSSRQQDLSDARITFAVPIKFAMDLMRVAPVL